MKAFPSSLALVLVSVFTIGAAQAQTPLTRDQVKAEFEEAVRTGDLLAPGDSGTKLNELYPNRYPKAAPVGGKTRAEVVAELEAAIRSGEVINGELGLKENELHPERYPAKPVAAGKTREQVRVEYVEAVRTGDIIAPGDSGLKLNEMYPQRYAQARADDTAKRAMAGTPAASAATAAAR
jgi:hypothetical protein